MSEKQLGIYVCGPLYGSGYVDTNVKRALQVAEYVRQCGAIPFVPHLFMFWHFRHGHPTDYWLEMDRHWLLKCDGLLVLPGVSPGSRLEEKWAAQELIPAMELPERVSFGDVRHALVALRERLVL